MTEAQSMSQPVVEILAIGNEILIGDIQDTNTHWLCSEVTRLGGRVRRACLLRDVPQHIAGEVRATLERAPDLVITTGGLGPTADDLTLAALAEAVGVRVELDAEARRQVCERYDKLATRGIVDRGGLNPAREKMARLPVGAAPVVNPIGTAPGVLMRAGRTSIVCLPGVPAEMRAIWQTSLQPLLHETFGDQVHLERAIAAECKDESLLAPVVNRVAANHPGVYVKSWATPFNDERFWLKVSVSASGVDRSAVDALLDDAMADLCDGFEASGIPIRPLDIG
jgi:molybdenum cofactor synthesis domain-containing protein